MEIRPSADLRNNYPEISKYCKEKRKPVFVTVNGRGDTVVMNIQDYEMQQAKLDVLEKLLAAEEDIRNGRVIPSDDVFERLDKKLAKLKAAKK